MKLLNAALKKELPGIMTAYKAEQRNDSRHDDGRDFEGKVRDALDRVAQELEETQGKYGLEEFVEKIAKLTQKKSLSEWKRLCRSTLGIDLWDDYYSGDFYSEVLKKWVDENVLKIKTIPTQTLGDMQQIILEGFRNGASANQIAKDIQEKYNVTKRQAELLARDQVGTLNSEITKKQHQDAGITHYKWSTSGDSRVRECHKALDGKTFSWDDPPQMWHMTKSRGKVMDARYCHPGQDYCCRCVAIPVYEIDTIDVPMKEKK